VVFGWVADNIAAAQSRRARDGMSSLPIRTTTMIIAARTGR
jgi:hypothetical protein